MSARIRRLLGLSPFSPFPTVVHLPQSLLSSRIYLNIVQPSRKWQSSRALCDSRLLCRYRVGSSSAGFLPTPRLVFSPLLLQKNNASMHNPEHYEKTISFQRRDSLYCLQKFGDKMKWRDNCSVIDVGSGDGSVTISNLKSHLPENFKKLLGVDVSKEMVDYANKKYGNEKISFDLLDIGGEVPQKYEEAFDHVFSSYALQFVYDQEKAYHNIYKLLKKNGTCLLLYKLGTPMVKAQLELLRKEKWAKYGGGADKMFANHYPLTKDRQLLRDVIKKLMAECGFKNTEVEIESTSYEYNSKDDLLALVRAANLCQLPGGQLLNEYMEEYQQELQLDRVEGKPNAVSLKYDRIVVFGCK